VSLLAEKVEFVCGLRRDQDDGPIVDHQEAAAEDLFGLG
jgi:hypothetical protein